MLKSDGNELIFVGKIADDLLPTCAALHNIVHKQGYRDVTLNFSQVGFLDASFMLPLVTLARHYRSDKVDFEIVMPNDEKSARLIRNANWAHLIMPENFEARDGQNREHLSAIQYLNPDDHFMAVNRSMEIMLRRSRGLDRSKLDALEWSLNEITDNVLNHSESPIGGVMQVITDQERRRIDFHVCDAGIGIPRSLRSGRPDIPDDVSAVRAAIQEGVTKNSSTYQGNGLFGTFRCCEVSDGDFFLLSGYVQLEYRSQKLRVRRNPIPFSGTFIKASIKYDVEDLLEKALVFKGKPYRPTLDYIERTYSPSGEIINFRVRDELDAFGSRESGRFARTMVENLMDKGKVAVEFDFAGINLISSSFADEVFGRLFTALGPIRFGQLCKFKNVEPVVQGLIDRSILQRMRQ